MTVEIEEIQDIVDEQYARQNKNNNLACNKTVLSWGKDVKHKYKDWKEWFNNY